MENIKDTAKFYKDNNYVVIKNFISKEQAKFIYDYCNVRAMRAKIMIDSKWPGYRQDVDGTYSDSQVPGTYSCYADPVMETVLANSLESMRKITGLKLMPTYSYWRLYKEGDVLKRHKDRPSCEVSTTLCLGYNNENLKGRKKDWKKYNWPMWVDKTGGVNNKGVPIHLEPGDMIVYRGVIIEHWREPFLGKNHAQVFLHYNDVDGPFKDNCVYDCRPMFGLPDAFKDSKRVEKMNQIDIKESNKYIKQKDLKDEQ